jgi:hypothetical protein
MAIAAIYRGDIFCFFIFYLQKNNLKNNLQVKIEGQEKYGDTIFFHPDYTVGSGIAPDPALRLAD